MRFGLALSGGATRGVAHIGALKALEEAGLRPSWISGTSAGSMVGALYSCGYTPRQMEEIAVSLKKNVYDTDYFGIARGVLSWILTKDTRWDGIVKGKNIGKLMKDLTGGKLMTEAKIPLAITAVDINTAKTVIFVSNKRGLKDTKNTIYIDNVPMYEAVGASIAIPVVFRPKIIDGMRLVDGGVTENVPVDVLKKMGAGPVIGINLGYSGQRRNEVDNILEIGSQTLDIMAYYMTQLKSNEAACMIYPEIYDVGMTEMHRIPEMIRRGYQAVKNNMDMIKKAINS